MKSRRKHGFQFMTILYFLIVFCMCVSRFNVIMTIMGGQLTRVEEINLLPFHSIRENLKYGRSPVSWDKLYNMVMFVPFGVIYCYYQKNFRVYKAVGMSCLTTFFIESAQLVLKTGVVDIDDLIVNTLGSLTGIDVCCLHCGNVPGRWFAKIAASSLCSVTVLWNFCLCIFNKGFYSQSKSLLSGMLCGSLLSEPCATVEIMA